MQFEDLVRIYEKKKEKYGTVVFRHISEILKEAKEQHYADWQKKPTRAKDHEQSWRSFKGKNLEKLIVYILRDEVENMGLKIVEGSVLERKKNQNLSLELKQVKQNLLVDFREFGFHLPDVDIIIYEPKTCRILAVVSCKVTLRERIAQTGYWNLKLKQNQLTRHIKVFFITPDEDRTLSYKTPDKKGRAIVEKDLNGSYIMNDEEIELSEKVKKFDQFIDDLKKLIEDGKEVKGKEPNKPAGDV